MAHDGFKSAALHDGDEGARRLQLELLRRMGPQGRFALARSLTATVLAAQRDELAHASSGLTDDELCVRLVARWYGTELAERVRKHLSLRHS